MKTRYTFPIVASLAMLFASCDKNDQMQPAPENPNLETVTFNLATEQGAEGETKAATKTVSGVGRYIMEVWDKDGTTKVDCFTDGSNVPTARAVSETPNGDAFKVVLDRTKDYTILFWADDHSTYDVTDLKAVKLRDDTTPMNEHAYFHKFSGKITSTVMNVTLTRAVAKINYQQAGSYFNGDKKTVTVTYEKSYTFNCVEGKPNTGTTNTSRTFVMSDKKLSDNPLLGTDYHFATTTDGENTLINITVNVSDESATARPIDALPIGANKATTLKGQFSANATSKDFDITSLEAWGMGSETPFVTVADGKMNYTVDNSATWLTINLLGDDIQTNFTASGNPTAMFTSTVLAKTISGKGILTVSIDEFLGGSGEARVGTVTIESTETGIKTVITIKQVMPFALAASPFGETFEIDLGVEAAPTITWNNTGVTVTKKEGTVYNFTVASNVPTTWKLTKTSGGTTIDGYPLGEIVDPVDSDENEPDAIPTFAGPIGHARTFTGTIGDVKCFEIIQGKGVEAEYYGRYGSPLTPEEKLEPKNLGHTRKRAVITAADAGTGKTWGLWVETGVTDKWNGLANTTKLAGLSGSYLGAKVCADLGYGWYLPAQNQLAGAWVAHSALTDFTANYYYWSSTENSYNSYNSWYVNFRNGYVNPRSKSSSSNVRCVRDL